MKLFYATVLAAFLLLSNVVLAGDAQQLINQAEATRQQAAKAGFEWTTTEGLIAEAKKALDSGDEQLAISLANKALRQGQNSLAQAKFSDEHWRDFEPR